MGDLTGCHQILVESETINSVIQYLGSQSLVFYQRNCFLVIILNCNTKQTLLYVTVSMPGV